MAILLIKLYLSDLLDSVEKENVGQSILKLESLSCCIIKADHQLITIHSSDVDKGLNHESMVYRYQEGIATATDIEYSVDSVFTNKMLHFYSIHGDFVVYTNYTVELYNVYKNVEIIPSKPHDTDMALASIINAIIKAKGQS